MGIFSSRDKQTISDLKKEIVNKDRRIKQLESLCNEKDEFFLSAISDGLRHGSSEAARHMADRKKYLHGK